MAKRPALLVPYPHATNNHQLYNAQILEKSGLGRIVLDHALTAEIITDYLAAALTQRAFWAASAAPSAPQAAGANLFPHDAAARLAAYLVSNLI